jgi:hypothetical protein
MIKSTLQYHLTFYFDKLPKYAPHEEKKLSNSTVYYFEDMFSMLYIIFQLSFVDNKVWI